MVEQTVTCSVCHRLLRWSDEGKLWVHVDGAHLFEMGEPAHAAEANE